MAAMITLSILNNCRDIGSMLSFPVNVINMVRASFTHWSTPKLKSGTRAPVSERFYSENHGDYTANPEQRNKMRVKELACKIGV